MPYADFREFLSFLKEIGQLKSVARVVDRKLEVARVIKKACEEKGPALLFENVEGFSIPVAGAVYGTVDRVCMGLDTDLKNFAKDYAERADRFVPPKVKANGPIKDKIILGDKVDLRMLPALHHAEKDAGYYLTATVVIVKDPDLGVRNASVHRALILDENKLSMWVNVFHLWEIIKKYWDRGEACPVAIALGTDPAVIMAASSKIPYKRDEMEFAGALKGQPIELVKCETVELDMPATAEIVIEGQFPPNQRTKEGPFGEFFGYYGSVRSSPIVQVSAICHRKNPIYHAILTGVPPTENQPMHLPIAAEVYRVLRSIFPEERIKGVNLTEGGCIHANCVIALKKFAPGDAKLAINAALSRPDIKNVVIVDDEINPFDPIQVEWAITTRSKPEDFIVIPKSRGSVLDPTSIAGAVTKLGIDATLPLGGDKVGEYSEEMLGYGPCWIPTEDINLGDYIAD